MLYRWNAAARRTPASVEKLLMAMALLDAVPLDKKITTTAYASNVLGGIITGDLWLTGRGDPTITGGSRYGNNFPFEPTRLGKLARKIKAAGVTRVQGKIMGSTRYFTRDWWAPGWKSDFPARYIPRPTALTFDGNVNEGRHTSNPERLAARALRRRLKAMGIEVTGRFGAGRPPTGMIPVARVRSVDLSRILQYSLRKSSNFFAEELGKRSGLETSGRPSIAGGADAIETWASTGGADVEAFDSSGLSYSNRVAPHDLTDLLGRAEVAPWGPALRSMLPGGGQGTLENRFANVPLRAKTGTLTSISTLAGWVWLKETRSWAEFAVMSSGMSKSAAIDVERRILRIMNRRAR